MILLVKTQNVPMYDVGLGGRCWRMAMPVDAYADAYADADAREVLGTQQADGKESIAG
jgi:hypothetical protein